MCGSDLIKEFVSADEWNSLLGISYCSKIRFISTAFHLATRRADSVIRRLSAAQS
jgi:hypothetical protein